MKPRIAVIGANGQVGAELCLILRNFTDVSVVPIVRSRRGSSYLRWKGVACRHGSMASAEQAPGLIGDCDLILNLALPSGLPREVRKENRDIIEHSARFAKPGARVVYFSTQSVYGVARPDASVRWRNGYGREKLRGEKDALRSGVRHGRDTWVLRLGHVCGELQGISQGMRRQVLEGPVVLAGNGSFLSNCTAVATIAATAFALLNGTEQSPGTYDLMDVPHRTWRQIYEHEASRTGVEANFESVPARQRVGMLQAIKSLVTLPMRGRAGNPVIHELGLQLLAVLPEKWGSHLQASYFQRRASAEIAALGRKESSMDASDWIAVPGPFFTKGLNSVVTDNDPRCLPKEDPLYPAFPADLPQANS